MLANTNKFDILDEETMKNEVDYLFLIKMLGDDDEVDKEVDGALFK